MHIENKAKHIRKDALIVLENEVSQRRWSLCFRVNNINEDKLNITYISSQEFLGGLADNMKNKLDGCIVLMNAPYLKRKWLHFVKKAVSLNPSIIETTNPDPTSSLSTFGDEWRTFCIENGLQDRTDVTHRFPGIKSGRISSFRFDRSKKANTDLLKSDDPIEDSIFSKIITANITSFVIRGEQRVLGYGSGKPHSISEENTITHIYPSIMSCTQDGLIINYSDTKVVYHKHAKHMNGRFVIVNRFFGQNDPDPAFLIDDIENYNISYGCLAFKLNEGETIENFMSVYASKLYRYAMSKMRNGGFAIGQGDFMRLVRLNLTKKWTDEKIYKELNLDKEEIETIKQHN